MLPNAIVRCTIGCIFGCALAAACSAAENEAVRPNIVFILVDDLRWDALGCTGHAFVKTPHIDRIASEGARFRNAFVTTPICLPSRACFLTGQYAHTHGVTGSGNHDVRSYELVTFPRLLQSAGYETGFVGKWHIGNDARPRPGFDRWVSFLGQGTYLNPVLNIDGKQVAASGYMTDLLTTHATEMIRTQRTKPLLLYLAYTGVHAPFVPADRHKELFAERAITRAPSAKVTLEGKPVLRREVTLSPNDPDVTTTDETIRNQLRCLMAVDEGVGKIFKALEEIGKLDQTLVVFTSDNGYFWGEHGLGGKHGPYEEALRIPLLIRYPLRIRSGVTLDGLVLNVDLAPTLLELGGASLPKSLHGRSLLPLLAGETATWRTSFLAEYFYNRGQTPRFPTWQAVRTDRWKYIRYPDQEGMDELYQLGDDRHEMTNRNQDPNASMTLAALKVELEQHLEKTR
jgi:N-acetylglucosamine-6-sulfatase